MKALLVCPAEREAVAGLSVPVPLACVAVFGKALIFHWIEHLVTLGAREIRVLAADRPEEVRALVGDGRRWGVRVEVSPEQRELTRETAEAKYRRPGAPGWLAPPDDIIVMDHFPGLPGQPLFESYGGWFAAVLSFLPVSVKSNRLGAREFQPGVWVGLRARISPDARLTAPCWIGANTMIGTGSVIGPAAILEDRVVVESDVEIRDSAVAPDTFIGRLTEVKNSLADGDHLIHWQTGSRVTVPDAFLMCSLARRRSRPKSGNAVGRLAALFVMTVTLPFALTYILLAKFVNQPALRSRTAVLPQLPAAMPGPAETMVYFELANCRNRLRRWPQLWNIVTGAFAWVGNHPLSPTEVAELTNDFERLWLAAPIGLVSLSDAEGLPNAFTDETRACASFYAVQANWRLDISILWRAWFGRARKPRPPA